MNPIKVFWNGKHLRDIYPHATRFQVFKYRVGRLIRKTLIVAGMVATLIAVFEMGGLLNPTLHFERVEAIKEVDRVQPVLERIAKCESGGNHLNKNGQVQMNANTNKTVDVGKYQINSVWFAKATELGFDLTKEADNEAMALWIYHNRGTGDWSSSAHCWK